MNIHVDVSCCMQQIAPVWISHDATPERTIVQTFHRAEPTCVVKTARRQGASSPSVTLRSVLHVARS